MRRADILTLFLDSITDYAVILLDTEGRIAGWHAGSERVFGYGEAEVLGSPYWFLFTPEDRARHIPEFEIASAAAGTQAADDRWMLRKDGSRFWAAGVLAPLRNADNKLIGFGKLLRNRTDLKGVVEALERRLETEQSAGEAKNRFISTLAHELRNPLSAAMAALELLGRSDVQSDLRATTHDRVRRQLERISRMAEDLLEATRIKVGKIKLDRQPVLLNDVVSLACETCQHSIAERSQILHLIAAQTPIWVDGDPKRLEQVFVNLIQNASKFTPRSGEIWVKLDLDGDDAMIRVEDTGRGIPPEVLPRIFDFFAQAEIPNGESGAGLGIGLSLVKELVSLHGGTVSAMSDGAGKGSRFFVRLPLPSSEAGGPHVPGARENPSL